MLSHLQTVSGGHVRRDRVELLPQRYVFTADVEWMKYVFSIQPPKMTLPKNVSWSEKSILQSGAEVFRMQDSAFDSEEELMLPPQRVTLRAMLDVRRSEEMWGDVRRCEERRNVGELSPPMIWLSCDLESVRADAGLTSCVQLFTGIVKQTDLALCS